MLKISINNLDIFYGNLKFMGKIPLTNSQTTSKKPNIEEFNEL